MVKQIAKTVTYDHGATKVVVTADWAIEDPEQYRDKSSAAQPT